MSQCIRSYLVDTKFALWNSGGGTPQRYKQWFLRDFKDYTKPFDCVDHNKLWKTLKEMGTLDHLIWTWKLDMEKRTGSKLVKEYIKTVYRCSIISRDNNNCWIIEKAREFQKKNLLLLYWLCQSLWLCISQQTENSSRNGNTRPPYLPYLPPEKSVCRSRSNS